MNLILYNITIETSSKKWVLFTERFVKEMLDPCIKHNIQVVAQLSRIDACNKHSLIKERMYIVREDEKYFELCRFTILCNVISRFSGLSLDILKEGITLSL